MSSEKLNSAITAINSGDKATGMRLLAEVIYLEPSNETAWIWLATCVDDIKQKKSYLNKALSINPKNEIVIKALSILDQPPQPTLEQIAPTLTEEVAPSEKPIPKEDKSEITAPLKKIIAAPVKQNYKNQYKPQKKSHTLIIVLIIVFLVLCLISQLSKNDGEDSGGTANRAKIMCESIIEAQLKAPSTAKFSGTSATRMYLIKNQPNAYRIIGYVDAQNSFGAQIRTPYTCDIKYNGGEWTDITNWTLLSLDME